MNVIFESLGDPIWQIGGGIIILVTLVLLLALRSPDVHLSPGQQWVGTRVTLLVCLSLFLLLSAGVALSHGTDATSTETQKGPQPPPATSVPSVEPSLTPISTRPPSPTPFPSLTPSPAQVLRTFCNAIDRHDSNTAWEQYAKALQKERIQPPPASVRLTIVHCRVDQVSETSATGFLLLQTVGPYAYSDGYERPFQLTLKVEDGAWKIAQIARCLSDGCLDATTSVVP